MFSKIKSVFKLERDRVYIRPTRYGFMYAGGSFLCFLCAIIYVNNLAYLLCFFLLSIFVIGMHQSNHNLRKLKFEKLDIKLLPSQSVCGLTLWLKSKNSSGHVRVNVGAKFSSKGEELSGHINLISPLSLSANRIKLQTSTRGAKTIDRIIVSSIYPFGLFHVWRSFKIKQSYLVFPKPLGDKKMPSPENIGSVTTSDHILRGEDFKEHKTYEPGDSVKKIDWKAYARGRSLLVKQFDEGSHGYVPLILNKTSEHLEENLQQMSKWILNCNDKGLIYSLKVGNQYLDKSMGLVHKNKALKILAQANEGFFE